MTCAFTSFNIDGQYNTALILSCVFLIPWCSDIRDSCAACSTLLLSFSGTINCIVTSSFKISLCFRYSIPFFISNWIRPFSLSGSLATSLAIFQYFSSVLSSICIFNTSAGVTFHSVKTGHFRGFTPLVLVSFDLLLSSYVATFTSGTSSSSSSLLLSSAASTSSVFGFSSTYPILTSSSVFVLLSCADTPFVFTGRIYC